MKASQSNPAQAAAQTLPARIDALDWTKIAAALNADGMAASGVILKPDECAALRAMYGDETLFRSCIDMARYGFGRGEYKYFSYPLPPAIAALRESLWPHLAAVANAWHAALDIAQRFPAAHADFIAQCHAAGQLRPTPLLLKYGAGDYNCLHQDLYGALAFPLQAVILLSEPAADFTGGELVLTEQRPRMQSRPQVAHPALGEIVFFAVHQRPVRGTRGSYRVNMRHGVSRILSGERYTLGVIFHDAA